MDRSAPIAHQRWQQGPALKRGEVIELRFNLLSALRSCAPLGAGAGNAAAAAAEVLEGSGLTAPADYAEAAQHPLLVQVRAPEGWQGVSAVDFSGQSPNLAFFLHTSSHWGWRGYDVLAAPERVNAFAQALQGLFAHPARA